MNHVKLIPSSSLILEHFNSHLDYSIYQIELYLYFYKYISPLGGELLSGSSIAYIEPTMVPVHNIMFIKLNKR